MALHKFRLAAQKTFGRFPKTEELEAKDNALRKEYDDFLTFGESKDYTHYLELKNYVDSGEPKRVKKELELLKYPGSQEQFKELELKRLSKDKALKNYLKVKDSADLSFTNDVELSGKPVRHKELKQFVESPDYLVQRKSHKKNDSEEYKKELIYKQLKKNPDLKRYFKLINSTPFKDYSNLKGSDKVTSFNELKEFIHSQEFVNRKTYLLSKRKFEQSKEYKKVQEYEELKKSERIVWYKSLKGSTKFDEIKRWELIFADNFEEKSLDKNKWITRYYWGEALLNKSYSLAADNHYYTDGKNIELNNGILKIITKKEEVEGLAWDLKLGFIPKKFEYTSGLISTGQSFRQKHGRFEAKVRFTDTPGVYHAFWLVGDKMLPHIDIFRKNSKNTFTQGSMYTPKDGGSKPLILKTKLGGFNFSSNFFILSIDWDAKSIVWKINGVPYMETTQNLPSMPAYLVFSSGVVNGVTPTTLPASLEIDWVKCWKENSTKE
ncbi:MAG: glycoside hydrolase family 16 protein [Bacteroidales bacterium]|nr:glycoside hydrolase family 16 protein [Bacteroidales bacterium]MDD3891445.1 glycoside hydrolase family 16 protein [Bacteroidales bacterium]